MNQSSEDAPVIVNGAMTTMGLLRIFGAFWKFDYRVKEAREKIATKLGYIMEERDGLIRWATGSYLNIEQTTETKRTETGQHKLFLIQGELEPDELDVVIGCDIDEHWESYGDDELGPKLIEIGTSESAPHYSIHPSTAPPGRLK
jgi:hypothetical protein